MLGHIEEFNRFRLLLQEALSIQVASGVDDLVFKMDMVLASLFSPKANWEKELASQSRRLGKMEAWINDGETLLSLVSKSKDPLLNVHVERSELEILTELQHLKKDIGMSLDELCERNLNMFELKLNLHTQKMQEAILNSARFVVRTLSGPYDRLHNEVCNVMFTPLQFVRTLYLFISIGPKGTLEGNGVCLLFIYHLSQLTISLDRTGCSAWTTSFSPALSSNITLTNSRQRSPRPRIK